MRGVRLRSGRAGPPGRLAASAVRRPSRRPATGLRRRPGGGHFGSRCRRQSIHGLDRCAGRRSRSLVGWTAGLSLPGISGRGSSLRAVEAGRRRRAKVWAAPGVERRRAERLRCPDVVEAVETAVQRLAAERDDEGFVAGGIPVCLPRGHAGEPDGHCVSGRVSSVRKWSSLSAYPRMSAIRSRQ